MSNFFDTVIKILKADDRFFTAEGELLRNAVYEAAMKMDAKLIKMLFENSETKARFFTDVDGISVFDKVGFGWVINNREFLPDSYTRYKNKIGLVNDKADYISTTNNVVLAFPYKDCVLEGGQTNDDQTRKEVFYNALLAPDEVDRLLAPKVLVNAKRFADGADEKADIFSGNDNLIIKGNNLLGISTLLKKYESRIRCIYIDPPYNTHSAANTFAYNNSFNHSSWLTFMKNRLEIAKKLLSKDGIIVCAIDHYELFYLGVLMDEIFGIENQMGVCAVVHNPGGRQDEKFFPTAHENMLVYAKDINLVSINNLPKSEDKLKEFKFTDKYGNYKLRGFRRSGNNSLRTERPALYYEVYIDPSTNRISLTNFDGAIKLLPIDDEGTERCWRWEPETLLEKQEKYIEIKKVQGKYDLYTKERECDYQGERSKSIWNKSEYSGQTATNEIKKIFGDKAFSYPKSVFLMIDVLSVVSNKDDIILDFFGGSGTTAHAVLELNKRDGGNRRFILCEQMDYAETVTYERIKKVKQAIDDKSPVVYCELAKSNQNYVDRIQALSDDDTLVQVWAEIQKTGFISSKIDPNKIDTKADDFKELSLYDKKKLLMELLDLNQLYINYCDIDDETFAVSDADKAFTKSFYGEE